MTLTERTLLERNIKLQNDFSKGYLTVKQLKQQMLRNKLKFPILN